MLKTSIKNKKADKDFWNFITLLLFENGLKIVNKT
jgi:hypothetical protein